MTLKNQFKIKELEIATGVPRSTIHHYVNQGLLHRPLKTSHTMAYYDDTHIKRLEAIQKVKLEYLKRTKSTRIPLDYIKHKLSETYSLVKPPDDAPQASPDNADPKRQQKKEAIIEATLQLYAHRGYYLTNIRDIVRAVGITSPTFYRYFKDKRELFVETIEYVVRKYTKEIKEAMKNEKDPTQRSKIMFKIFYAHYPMMGEILNQLRSGVIIGDPWSCERLSRLYREMMGNLIRELQGGMRNGIIRKIDPVLMAYFNLAVNEAAIHLTSMDKSYSIDVAMSFAGEILNNAFLTDKGNKEFNVFYKSSGQD